MYDSNAARGAAGAMAEEVQRDLRKAHFSFGYDSDKHYTPESTVSMRDPLASVGGTHEEHAAEKKRERENAKQLKLTLMKTSIVLGDDEKYMH